MAQSKPTPGPWYVNISRLSDGSICAPHVVASDGRSIAQLSIYSDAETCGNAALIAEAGTIAHETGLTPRQLAERLAFWLDFAKANIGRMDADELAAFEADRTAIAKAEQAS